MQGRGRDKTWPPAGVPRAPALVSSMTQFVSDGLGATRSPELAGSWLALRWLGAPDGESSETPLTSARGGAPYPDTSWWEDVAPDLRPSLSAAWWAARRSVPANRYFAHGVSVALLWAAGDDRIEPLRFAPVHFDDGTLVPAQTRELCAQRVRELWTRHATGGPA
jgi:hypothetical protein